jgi:hypothetical protein
MPRKQVTTSRKLGFPAWEPGPISPACSSSMIWRGSFGEPRFSFEDELVFDRHRIVQAKAPAVSVDGLAGDIARIV